MIERLAYLCGEYPRATDTFIQREVKGLRNAGFHIDTISVRRPSKKEQGTKEQTQERERTHYLIPCSPWRLLSDHFGLLCRSPIRYLKGFRMALSVRSPGLRSLIYQLFYFAEAGLVAAYMRRKELTHIHNHAPDACGYVAMLASQIANLTFSMTLHGFGIFSESGKWRLKEKIEQSLFTICISQHGRSQAMLWSDQNCWSKIHVVHCGLDLGKKTKRHHTGRGRNVLFVGRLDHVKGLPVLIDAVSNLIEQNQEIHLHIVGDGPSRTELENIVKEKALSELITFYGYKSQEELQEFFAMTDIFVMTSFYEGIPVVLMEALSHGVPVIAPCITGIPELVKNDVSGLLTIPADSNSLAEQMKLLLNDPERRNRYIENGQKIIEKDFNISVEINRLAAIIKDA
ncbi:MAG: glycosyltransferase family 4 protein [Spirochaetaceae bacterium]|nr:glycosyltransferase family 4 protein [Spirochaetaceae bacterium]